MAKGNWFDIALEAGDARRAGDYQNAEKLYLEALSKALPFMYSDHQVIILHNTVADFYRQQGMLDKALQFAREGLMLGRRTLPPDNILIGNDLMFLAMLLNKYGQYEEAERMAEEGLSIFEKNFGKTSPQVVENQKCILKSIRTNMNKHIQEPG